MVSISFPSLRVLAERLLFPRWEVKVEALTFNLLFAISRALSTVSNKLFLLPVCYCREQGP